MQSLPAKYLLRVEGEKMRKTSIHTIHTLGVIGEAQEDGGNDEEVVAAPILR